METMNFPFTLTFFIYSTRMLAQRFRNLHEPRARLWGCPVLQSGRLLCEPWTLYSVNRFIFDVWL